MQNKKNHGFTLIELLVVITIIGFLTSLAVVALNNARSRSRDAKRMADMKQMQTALSLYYNDQKYYPKIGTAALGYATNRRCLGTLTTGFTTLGCSNAYVPILPLDPSRATAGTFRYLYYGKTGNDYQDYCLRFNLEKAYPGYFKGLNYLYPNGSVSNTACAPW